MLHSFDTVKTVISLLVYKCTRLLPCSCFKGTLFTICRHFFGLQYTTLTSQIGAVKSVLLFKTAFSGGEHRPVTSNGTEFLAVYTVYTVYTESKECSIGKLKSLTHARRWRKSSGLLSNYMYSANLLLDYPGLTMGWNLLVSRQRDGRGKD